MDILKSIVKIIAGLLGGIVIGLLIAALGLVGFTDTSFPEFIEDLLSAGFAESMGAAGIGVLAFVVSSLFLIPIHEAGHLVCGLLSGYGFVSFRIFSYTVIKAGGRLRIKRFAVANTGGQCLMTPPALPLEEIPTMFYNFGGVLANIVAVLLVLPMLYLCDNPFLIESVVVFIFTGIMMILFNGIPMRISGAGNDAYNMLSLRKNMVAKLGMVNALRMNALIQNGIRPKDMPGELFEVPDAVDYGNPLEVSLPMAAASRHVDEMRYDEAKVEFEELYENRGGMIGLYVKEIACELVFLRLMCGDKEGALELFDNDLRKYIEQFRKMMSSKERILCAVSLLIDNDRARAVAIYENLRSRKGEYLLQGEVRSDLALMREMIAKDNECDSEKNAYEHRGSERIRSVVAECY